MESMLKKQKKDRDAEALRFLGSISLDGITDRQPTVAVYNIGPELTSAAAALTNGNLYDMTFRINYIKLDLHQILKPDYDLKKTSYSMVFNSLLPNEVTELDGTGEVINYQELVINYTPEMLNIAKMYPRMKRSILLSSRRRYSDRMIRYNNELHEKYPFIQLTWEQFHDIKCDLRWISNEGQRFEFVVVAQAYVYFEKLVIGNWITKDNGRRCAGACLLIAAKLNDIKLYQISELNDAITDVFKISRKELYAAEFAVLVALEFKLFLSASDLQPHFDRLKLE